MSECQVVGCDFHGYPVEVEIVFHDKESGFFSHKTILVVICDQHGSRVMSTGR